MSRRSPFFICALLTCGGIVAPSNGVHAQTPSPPPVPLQPGYFDCSAMPGATPSPAPEGGVDPQSAAATNEVLAQILGEFPELRQCTYYPNGDPGPFQDSGPLPDEGAVRVEDLAQVTSDGPPVGGPPTGAAPTPILPPINSELPPSPTPTATPQPTPIPCPLPVPTTSPRPSPTPSPSPRATIPGFNPAGPFTPGTTGIRICYRVCSRIYPCFCYRVCRIR